MFTINTGEKVLKFETKAVEKGPLYHKLPLYNSCLILSILHFILKCFLATLLISEISQAYFKNLYYYRSHFQEIPSSIIPQQTNKQNS